MSVRGHSRGHPRGRSRGRFRGPTRGVKFRNSSSQEQGGVLRMVSFSFGVVMPRLLCDIFRCFVNFSRFFLPSFGNLVSLHQIVASLSES